MKIIETSIIECGTHPYIIGMIEIKEDEKNEQCSDYPNKINYSFFPDVEKLILHEWFVIKSDNVENIYCGLLDYCVDYATKKKLYK